MPCSFITVLGGWTPFGVTTQPIIDFIRLQRICRTTALFSEDQIHPTCECPDVALLVTSVPLPGFFAKFSDGQYSLPKITGQLDACADFCLSFLVKRNRIGTPPNSPTPDDLAILRKAYPPDTAAWVRLVYTFKLG
jgi:hypothetical protein